MTIGIVALRAARALCPVETHGSVALIRTPVMIPGGTVTVSVAEFEDGYRVSAIVPVSVTADPTAIAECGLTLERGAVSASGVSEEHLPGAIAIVANAVALAALSKRTDLAIPPSSAGA